MERTIIDLERMSQLFKLLGDKTRLTMVGILTQRECCVCEFVEVFEMSQPSISQHLRKLKDAGLVKETRRGQWIYYSLNKQNDLYGLLNDILRHFPAQDEKINKIIQCNPTEKCGC
ncbi:winged helix-turn-helix transcriptional regulator [Bacillus sp. DNRA2]|uniref:ArsR/SmtB family transcription factor n=1 Tax=Bacillus sp. DNRA2 TaxID=2723053 RepID=UPI00145F8BEF|nr:metalloregulator ArsR/SmtB family transcription factor [Bacillus sp. DNRA2]NMD71191.1 winged helix-turn-helix transcriptional regulator [Bacillus sp. DNRA2]